MRRRDLIKILVGTAAFPGLAMAQRRTVPVIGFLGFEAVDPKVLAKFHQGLNERGYFEGRNVMIEYQWAIDGQQISALAANLVQHQVALIVTAGGTFAAKAAKQATATIPILFGGIGIDHVEIRFI